MGIEGNGGFPRMGNMVVFQAEGGGGGKSTDVKPVKQKKRNEADLFQKWTGLPPTDARVKKVRVQVNEKEESKKKQKKQPWED